MTNIQFYTAIGIQLFAILLVWLGSTLANNRAVDSAHKRIEDLRLEIHNGINTVVARLDQIDARLGKLENEINKDYVQRLTRLESRVFSAPAA